MAYTLTPGSESQSAGKDKLDDHLDYVRQPVLRPQDHVAILSGAQYAADANEAGIAKASSWAEVIVVTEADRDPKRAVAAA